MEPRWVSGAIPFRRCLWDGQVCVDVWLLETAHKAGMVLVMMVTPQFPLGHDDSV